MSGEAAVGRPAAAAVTVTTVTGPISSAELGVTLPHEHLANDLSAAVQPPRDANQAILAESTVSADIAWRLREAPYACPDNCGLADTEAMVESLREFATCGGGSVIDLTPPGLGRDPAALRDIAERTGLNVVMGSGWYLQRFHPPHLATTGEDDLAAELVAEFRAPAGPRPGVIGEIGVSPDFTSDERTALRAACLAQRALGVPMFVHLPGWRRRAHEVLDIVLDEQGVAPTGVVLCHMDPSGQDPDYQRGVADRGVWLEFDMVGMPFLFPGEGQAPPPWETAGAVRRLVGAGHAGQILLSHDVFLKAMLPQYGGNGFAYVPTLFAQRLRDVGVEDSVVTSLLRDNPRSLFDSASGAAG
ncbi:phosphotriesterase-related protein [Spiractinospora alimapuensis]|uniref:phosphotriesterase family protein n=1 Tax=Spiractinospora alimapuensis TaxID=2820884 RepID=UPI001F2310E7|nr:phosphotriesterase-related protein [Spiractinospora alimapuensis]QVQ51773.1 phosphotriesterase-related protein [Spiractinospora alimapuensis]